MKHASIAIGLAMIATAITPSSLAQTNDETLDTLERLPPRIEAPRRAGPGDPRDLRGVRIARPGALLFASFDSDGSLSVSKDEIIAGAQRSLAVADKDASGTLSIFEQQDFAAAIGAHDGRLANATAFDLNFDRQVTLEEFTDGLLRIARTYRGPDTDELSFAVLLQAPAGASETAPPPAGARNQDRESARQNGIR